MESKKNTPSLLQQQQQQHSFKLSKDYRSQMNASKKNTPAQSQHNQDIKIDAPHQEVNQNKEENQENDLQKQEQQQPEPIAIVKPMTPEEIELKPDYQTLELLSLIIARLKILERNIANSDETIRGIHAEREMKLSKINNEISQLYIEYQHFLNKEEDIKEIEKRIKVEIDYNLVRIMENKLKMDKEVYVMKKKLYDRTVRMRELQVSVYNLKQIQKDNEKKIKELESDIESKDKELRRMQDIVYDVTALNIKPSFGFGNRLSVPNYKNYDHYMLQQQKEQDQQRYFLENQTLKFGRRQQELLKDGYWQTQMINGSISQKNLLQNTGQAILGPQAASLGDILPDSWINSKFRTSIDKPTYDSFNERSSLKSSMKSSSINGRSNLASEQNNGGGFQQYY